MASYKIIQDKNDLEKAKAIRLAVFVEEQGVALEDEFDQFDGLEEGCQHILVYHEGEAVGTGRIRYVDDYAKLERICMLEPYRKYGLGRVIIASLEEISRQTGKKKYKLHAQVQAKGFYEKLGYKGISDEFEEDGIPHVIMEKQENVG
ncbi:GNAT family N-acetyltransferase [Terribacillus saccharophilus]|uniref:GNAT family N-acetyltransferase n=1 Tax=Terribacillus saccharophilus TaxID=361277 RepID=UPI000BA612BB|nr:GNAT family N-acetyltransferase [Terribacillus saccharophilus]PAF16882.1 GNAT family N-acetyltransferase [Terribacillus saccharophilus]